MKLLPVPRGPFIRTNSILCEAAPEKRPNVIRCAILVLRLDCKVKVKTPVISRTKVQQRAIVGTHPGVVNFFQSVVSDRAEEDDALNGALPVGGDQLHAHHLPVPY